MALMLSAALLLGLTWAPSASAAIQFSVSNVPVNPGAAGIAVGDFNGDHRPDLATANLGELPSAGNGGHVPEPL